MIKNSIFYVKVLLTLIGVLFATQVIALPVSVPFNTSSPLYKDSQRIADIYIKSCNTSLDQTTLNTYFPNYTKDKITEKFKSQTTPESFKLHYQTLGIVSAGFDFGVAIGLTDLSLDEKQNQCRIYGTNFTATVVNNAQSQTGEGAILPPSLPQPFSSLNLYGYQDFVTKATIAPNRDNPLYDLIIRAREANKPRVTVTPRLSEQNGCRYMYGVLAMQPVIEVNALDATLDIMVNMFWDGYSNQDIRNGYSFFLQGAKFGRFLFAAKQPVTMCYD